MGEYLSREFEIYLESKGIHHELAAPYSPAQNGVAERLNHTLMESACAMLDYLRSAGQTLWPLQLIWETEQHWRQRWHPMRNGMVENLTLYILECLVVWLTHMYLTVKERKYWIRKLKSYNLLDTVFWRVSCLMTWWPRSRGWPTLVP